MLILVDTPGVVLVSDVVWLASYFVVVSCCNLVTEVCCPTSLSFPLPLLMFVLVHKLILQNMLDCMGLCQAAL